MSDGPPDVSESQDRSWMHQPAGYDCPFCRLISGTPDDVNRLEDVVARTDRAIAFIAPRWWPNNPGHVLVVPTAHVENLYAISTADNHAVTDLVQRVAIGIRSSYGCAGVSTRQHNEPAGYQDVWHLHVDVFPRYAGDHLYRTDPVPGWAPPDERQPYAEKLRAALADRS